MKKTKKNTSKKINTDKIASSNKKFDNKKTLTNIKKISLKNNLIQQKTKTASNFTKDVPHIYWSNANNEILILGTAHVSKNSLEDVKSFFTFFKPTSVAVELCKPRYEAISQPNRWKNLDISQIVKQKKIWLLTSNLILLIFQKKIGEQTGVMPGDEMKLAIELAKKNNLKLLLVDRNIQVTLSRAWGRVGFFSKFWLFSFLTSSIFINESSIDEKEIENLKKTDALEGFIDTLPKQYSSLKNVILDERDIYISESLKKEFNIKKGKKEKTLVVLGAAHLKGVEKYLKSNVKHNLDDLLTVPPKSLFKTAFSILFFTSIFFGISSYLYKGNIDLNQIKQMTKTWVLCRGIGAGVGTLIAGSSFLTFISTVLFAPLSYFLSFVGLRLWMVTALVELRSKKPTVQDFENLGKDVKDLKSFFANIYKNKVLHLIFLIFATSTGLTIGNVIFFKFLISDIFKLF